ncbi:MAG: signal recognition particle protein [Oligoflexia bacterium]|nr:signal recognition particle protein [Oligoflexia bacterium]
MFDHLSEKISDAFRSLQGKSSISESNIEETLQIIRSALLEADVNFKVVKNFLAQVKEKALGVKVLKGVDPGEQFVKIVHDELTAVMGGESEKEIDFDRLGSSSGPGGSKMPMPLLIVGLNGAGKTTFSGKIALHIRKKFKKDVLLIPADTNRPAAKEQLIILAKSIGADYFDSDLSRPPHEVVLAGLAEAKARGKDVAIIDTAGRLHVDTELMEELKQVKAVIADHNPEVLLVVDAMSGQEAVSVAETFQQEIGISGVVLTKVDSDARGGAALSVRSVTGVPIRYLSVGEKLKDLELFHPDRLAKRILDMGDVVGLVEKAQEIVDEKEAARVLGGLEKNRFTIDDFWKQLNSMNKLGSMASILKMLPGMGGMLRQVGDITPAENEMKKIGVLISSMNKQERNDDKLLEVRSRRERIAKGSGTAVTDVDNFIKRFREMRQMMSGMMGMMKSGFNPLGALMGGGDGGGDAPSPQIKGFRQPPGGGGKVKKGKRRGPWGNNYF